MATQTITMQQLNENPYFKALNAAYERNPVDIYIAVYLTYEEKLMAFDEAIKICTAYKGHLKKKE